MSGFIEAEFEKESEWLDKIDNLDTIIAKASALVEMAKSVVEDRVIDPDIPSLDDSTIVGLLATVAESLVMMSLLSEDIHHFRRDHLEVKKTEQTLCC